MKIKLFLFFLVIILGAANHVWGSMVVFQVDATNIQTQSFFIKTDTSGNAAFNHSINFYVVADPKGPPYAPDDRMHWSLGGASLSIYRSSDFTSSNFICSGAIASRGIPSFLTGDLTGPLAKKGILFEFTVSTDQLANADFEVGYGSADMPAVDRYRFVLRTFAPEPSLGLELGMKENKMVVTKVQPDTPAARAGLTPGLVVQQIDGVDPKSYPNVVMAQDTFRFGIVDLGVMDPSTGRTNKVMLTTSRTFPGESR